MESDTWRTFSGIEQPPKTVHKLVTDRNSPHRSETVYFLGESVPETIRDAWQPRRMGIRPQIVDFSLQIQ